MRKFVKLVAVLACAATRQPSRADLVFIKANLSKLGGLAVLMLAMLPAASAFAAVTALPDDIIFSGGNTTVGSSDLIEGSIYSNNNITIGNNAIIQGSLFADNIATKGTGATVTGSTLQGAAVNDLPLITMQNIVDDLNAEGITFTQLALNTNYIADNNPGAGHITTSGVYLVDGNLTIASTFAANATFITNGNITVSSGVNLTGAVPISDLFPQGLTLFSGTGIAAFGGTGGNITASASSLTGGIYDTRNVTINSNDPVYAMTSPVPEPRVYAMMGVGLLLMGFVAHRRRRTDSD